MPYFFETGLSAKRDGISPSWLSIGSVHWISASCFVASLMRARLREPRTENREPID